MVCRYELTTTAMSTAMATPMGIEKCRAVVPARTRMSRISSVAYATEESASEEKTASADVFESRSWRARALGGGVPPQGFLRALRFPERSRRPTLAAPGAEVKPRVCWSFPGEAFLVVAPGVVTLAEVSPTGDAPRPRRRA